MDINQNQFKRMRKVFREQRLEHEEEFGKPRAKSWGGRKSAREDRKAVKKELDSYRYH